jgi:hypothetical protein
MKYIKNFESLDNNDVNIVFDQIISKYSEEVVLEMLDQEILEWVDIDWEDEYETEYDWYVDHNNGEAEDVIIGQLISEYEQKNNTKLDSDLIYNLSEKLKNYYNL